jgi:hypothetical protein
MPSLFGERRLDEMSDGDFAPASKLSEGRRCKEKFEREDQHVHAIERPAGFGHVRTAQARAPALV